MNNWIIIRKLLFIHSPSVIFHDIPSVCQHRQRADSVPVLTLQLPSLVFNLWFVFILQVRRALWPMALSWMGNLRVSLRAIRAPTTLNPQRDTSKSRMCPTTQSCTTRMTSVSIGIAITFTFIHLADASIQSDFDLLTYSISLITSYLMFYCVQLADRVSVYIVLI